MASEYQHILDDLNSFDNPNDFAKKLFETQSLEAIKEIVKLLEQKKEVTAEILKERVFNFYPSFISTVKHVHNFEQSVNTIRKLFSEQKEILEDLKINQHQNQLSSTSQLNISFSSPSSLSFSEEEEEKKITIIDDELDELITKQSCEEAVNKIQSIKQELNEKKDNLSNSDMKFQQIIDKRAESLAKMLLLQLKDTSLKKAQFQLVIQLLSRLQYENWASETFLQTKLLILTKKIREMKSENDICSYVRKLSKIVFNYISETYAEYLFSFPSEKLLSLFVVWSKKSVDLFYSSFSRHVFSSSNETQIRDCINIAKQSCSNLEKSGLPLSFYLSHLLQQRNLS